MNRFYAILFIIVQSGVQYIGGPKDKNQIITWSIIRRETQIMKKEGAFLHTLIEDNEFFKN
jgi:hypothetical protein